MVKKQVLFFLIGILSMGCQQSEVAQHLVGKWRYDIDTMRRKNISTTENPNGHNYFDSLLMGLENAELDFRSNGTLQFSLDSSIQEGSWQVRSNGSQLVFKLSDHPQISKIISYSGDTLVLAPIDNKSPQFNRILVPVDKNANQKLGVKAESSR
jgi:hypothetical protein